MEFLGPIIVVDDDPDDHVILKTVFESLEVTSPIKYFDSAASVLDYLRNTLDDPFIIFCDINMPRISGLDLRENIYYDHFLRRKNIPFVFMSSASSIGQVARAYELTVQGYFVKAQKFEEAERKIKLILQYWCECEFPNKKKTHRIAENR
jgi:DNA-binding NarL/FixJ family response regulator